MRDNLISRQAAINSVKEWLNKARKVENHSHYNDGEIAAYETALSELKEIPSAQPEQENINEAHNEGYDVGYWAGRRDYEKKWIPCSEKLPEENGRYLVTNSAWGAMEVDWNAWVNGAWLYPNTKPIAWMPLPEPYTAESEET